MPTVTLGSLKTRVYQYLEDNSLFYPPAEVTDAINEAIRTLNLFTGFLQFSTSIASIQNRVFYDVPAGMLMLQRVKFRSIYLEPFGLTSYSNSSPDWMLRTTANQGSPVSGWIPIGLRRFAITPADSVGGGAMLLSGIVEPTPLVNDSDTMTFPNEYDTTVIELTKHTLQLDEGGATFAQSSTGYQAFLSDAKKLSVYKTIKMPSYYVDQQLRK